MDKGKQSIFYLKYLLDASFRDFTFKVFFTFFCSLFFVYFNTPYLLFFWNVFRYYLMPLLVFLFIIIVKWESNSLKKSHLKMLLENLWKSKRWLKFPTLNFLFQYIFKIGKTDYLYILFFIFFKIDCNRGVMILSHYFFLYLFEKGVNFSQVPHFMLRKTGQWICNYFSELFLHH